MVAGCMPHLARGLPNSLFLALSWLLDVEEFGVVFQSAHAVTGQEVLVLGPFASCHVFLSTEGSGRLPCIGNAPLRVTLAAPGGISRTESQRPNPQMPMVDLDQPPCQETGPQFGLCSFT